jgi:uncharacterized protein YndB with AHSA1/START domain
MTTAKPKRAARAIADVGAGTILASVEIAAEPERVYRALTSPDEIIKWWGSDDQYRTTGWTSELKVGGRWRADGKGAEGPFSVEGEYLELDPPRRIVCTWKPDWDGGNTTTITYRLEPIEGGTRVVIRHEGFGERAESCRGHAEGWEHVLGWLRAHVAPTPPSSEPRFYVMRLLPPRPTFMVDMNEEERAMMGAHAVYWAEHLAAGRMVVYGPVADPKGGWGLGVVRVADEAELRALQEGDPAIRAGRGLSYEVLPMVRAIVGASPAS